VALSRLQYHHRLSYPQTSLLPDPNERGAQPLEEDILIDYYIDSKVLFSHTIHVQCEFTLMDNDGRSLSHRSSVPRAFVHTQSVMAPCHHQHGSMFLCSAADIIMYLL
jgi:hypothetical protein